ncbi:MAG TPA: metallophosphoesterase [Candidatus Nanoarchaeia archaeon]|nr:metallophosphoesterase [Candidatus Nanoarchaeia archaeon]
MNMEISPGIEMVDTALWIRKEKILIINDLHLGYEETLHRKGVLVPKFQLEDILDRLHRILQKVHPRKIIINGDLKHEFGTVLRQEWREVLKFLDEIISQKIAVVIIRGNHDPLLKPIAEKRGITIVKEYYIGDTVIVHGDAAIVTKAKRIIIGHEHPALTIREKSKREKYKCFLKGKWKGKELMAVPSFNPLLEGTDILKEELLSPFLKNIAQFEVYIVSQGEVFYFGKVKGISQK